MADDMPDRAHPPLIGLLSLLVILSLLIAAVGGYAYSRLCDAQRLETERMLTVIAEQKRQQIESWLARTREDARLYFSGLAPTVQRLAAWEAGGRQDTALLDQARERIADIQEVRGWSSLAVLDTQGEPIIILGPANFADLVHEIQGVLAHPRPLPLDLHPNAQGQVEYGLLTPITHPDGQLLGLAYLSWLADQSLFPLISVWPVPTQSAETYLVRREGEEVHYLTPLRHEADAALRKRLPLATPHLAAALAVQGQEGILPQSRDYRDEPVLAYVTAIAGSPWQMIAEIDQREAQAGMHEIAWVTALVLGLILLLIYSSGFAWWHRERQRLRMAALEASRLLEQRFRTIFEEAPLGVAVIDSLDGRVYEVNQRFADIAGRSREAIAQIDWMQITHPDDVQEDLDQMARLNAGEIPGFEMDKRYLQPDGTVVWINMTIAPLRVAPGERPRHLCMIQDITARRVQEQALVAAREANSRLESERRWKLALDAAGHGVWDWHLDSDRVDYSPTWKRMLGFDEAEIDDTVGAWEQLLHPEDLARIWAAVRAHLAGETPSYESVHRLRCQDGTWKWILDRGTVMERDADGKPLRMLGTLTDITAQKLAEEALRQTQQRLAEAQAIAHLGSFEYDAATRQTGWSDEEYRIYGLDPTGDSPVYDDLLARCIHPADVDLLQRTFCAALEQAGVFELEHRILRPDGSVRWVYDLAHPVCAADGHLVRYVGVTLDITERKQAEKQLRQSEARLRLATEGADLGVWYWDLATGKLEWSALCREHLALPADAEPSFDHFYAVIHPDDRARIEGLINAAVDSGAEYHAEYRIQHPDGRLRWISAPGRVYRNADGDMVGMGGITQDITARKVAEEEVRALNADLELRVELRTAEAHAASTAKSEFLAHMSHEIRTPLNAVLGLAQLLGRQALSPEQHALVERIQGAGQSLLGIINDILDFSKIEAGQLQLTPRPFRLETLTARVASLFNASATAKGLVLRIEPPPEMPGPLLGDALRLEQVLINLTGNAIKFTAQGEVALIVHTLATTDRETQLRFAVQDTGIGISPEVQATLFRPFIQADASITRRFGGTGLGLSIAKRLVELMGGMIGVDSQPGQGSTFWFEVSFPRTTATVENGLAAHPATPSGPRLRGLCILAVDDSAMNRDLVERALTLEGAKVTLAADGQQAVQYLQPPAQPFDAVLMDVQMPVMDGLTAMRLIRRELGLTDLPLLALTAGVLPTEQQAAREAGANEVLAKPLDLDQLAARLAHHIGAERLAAAAAGAGHAAGSEAGPIATSQASPFSKSQSASNAGAFIPPTRLAAAQEDKAGPESISTSISLPPGAGDSFLPLMGKEASISLPPHMGKEAFVPLPSGGGELGRGGAAGPKAFPVIPGIDRTRVTLTFRDDVDFFLAMLQRLTQEAAVGLTQARQALAAGDRETATRCLHSLKGNAGNIGALTLMAAAGRLEAALQAGAFDREDGSIQLEGSTDLEAGLVDLERQVADLTVASAPWLSAPPPRGQETPKGTLSPPLDAGQLAALCEDLRSQNLSALDRYEELESSLLAAHGHDRVAPLQEAIANLRFGAALTLLQALSPAASSAG